MSAVVKFPAGRLARKRKAKDRQQKREFLELCNRAPPKLRPVFRSSIAALVRLLSARSDSEFAKASKELLASLSKLHASEEARAQVQRLIDRGFRRPDGNVIPFAS